MADDPRAWVLERFDRLDAKVDGLAQVVGLLLQAQETNGERLDALLAHLTEPQADSPLEALLERLCRAVEADGEVLRLIAAQVGIPPPPPAAGRH